MNKEEYKLIKLRIKRSVDFAHSVYHVLMIFVISLVILFLKINDKLEGTITSLNMLYILYGVLFSLILWDAVDIYNNIKKTKKLEKKLKLEDE